jgi:hypothetical protein
MNVSWSRRNTCYLYKYFLGFLCACIGVNPEWGCHGLINYIAKCHLKKWPVKGLCGRCLSKFIERRFSQSCWYFLISFVNYCPLTFSLVKIPPLHILFLDGEILHCFFWGFLTVIALLWWWDPYSWSLMLSEDEEPLQEVRFFVLLCWCF